MLLQGTICFLKHKQQTNSVLGNLPCPQRSIVSCCGSGLQRQSFPLSEQEESISYCREPEARSPQSFSETWRSFTCGVNPAVLTSCHGTQKFVSLVRYAEGAR